MDILTYRDTFTGKTVKGFVFTGRDCLSAVEEFTHLKPYSVHQLIEEDANAVTCVLSIPVGNCNGFTIPLVLVPGYYLVRDGDGMIHSVAPRRFMVQFKEVTEKEEGEDGEHLDFD